MLTRAIANKRNYSISVPLRWRENKEKKRKDLPNAVFPPVLGTGAFLLCNNNTFIRQKNSKERQVAGNYTAFT